MQDQATTIFGPEGDDAPGLDELLAHAVGGTGAHMGALYLLAPEGDTLRMESTIGLPTPIASQWSRLRLDSRVPGPAAVRERRLVWVPGQEEMARHYPDAALTLPYPFSTVAAPIRTDEHDWGVLVLLWPAPHAPELSRQERDVIELDCRRMAVLLRRAAESGYPVVPGERPRLLTVGRSVEADPEEARAALDYVNRLPEGGCALDMDGRVTFMTQTAADLLGGKLSELVGARPWEVLPWLRDPVFEDNYRAAALSNQITAFTACNPRGERLAFELHSDPSGISVRIVPVPGPVRQDAPGETGHLIRPIRADTLYNLVHLATTLTRAVTVQDVVDLVAEQVMVVCEAQGMAVLLAENGRMLVVGSRNYEPEIIDHFDGLPLTAHTASQHVMITGEAEFFGSWEEMAGRHRDAVPQPGMAAWAVLPLIASDRPIGTVVLAYERPRVFTADERATLTSLAGLVAQALERARLYDVKHHLAEALQASLLPSALPSVPGLDVAARYLPATRGMDIGGDFYDLIRLDESMAAAVIGDVQGHDMTAAALMGQVRTAIHAHATAGASPGEVLFHTNRLLIDLAPDLFTSCLYVNLDLERHVACLASAGHLPPLLLPPGEPARIAELPAGLLLGLDPDADYPTMELPLPPGSMLALYTDGLIEAPGIDIGEGMEALGRRLTRCAGRPLAVVAQTLIDHALDVQQRTDDIALLLLKHP
ncbi:SpoIIE family protein phosphatase [Nonomuraea rhodomycinica]|uniref:protein-serine/threonine phosphatase n=1 Tax=Nonomuraea rhodomycinica TaxID=1712872 RepID=A0A7Y6ITZ5_9ACTN|nr:SpoIIE family protein phosphatase [Nonomuraea rhodomycinica]NUW43823.1 SpoIIE family protein phosphatase [Nonomuraea rhodomycinica]